MTLPEAYTIFTLPEGVNFYEVQRAYQANRSALQKLVQEATSISIQYKYDQLLEQNEEAYRLIAMYPSGDPLFASAHIGTMEVVDNDSKQDIEKATALFGLDETFPLEVIRDTYLSKITALEAELENTRIEKNKQNLVDELNKLALAWFVIERWFQKQEEKNSVTHEIAQPVTEPEQVVEPRTTPEIHSISTTPSQKQKSSQLAVVLICSVISALAGIGLYSYLQKDYTSQQTEVQESISETAPVVDQKNPNKIPVKSTRSTPENPQPSPEKKSSATTNASSSAKPVISTGVVKEPEKKTEGSKVPHTTQELSTENYPENFKRISTDARNGNAVAQYNLASFYEEGQGTTKNMAEAVKWYRKAAAQGHLQAQLRLAAVYATGKDDVQKNMEEAGIWFNAAARQGNADAQYYLGTMYFKGEGVKQDTTMALHWLKSAQRQGHTKAAEALEPAPKTSN